MDEVVPFTTDTSIIGNTTTIFVVMNNSKWNSLSPNLQNIFERISDLWVKRHGEAWDKQAEDAVKFSDKVGHKFIRLTEDQDLKLQEIVKPFFENYKQTIPNGTEYIRTIEDLIVKASDRKCPKVIMIVTLINVALRSNYSGFKIYPTFF